MTLAYYTIAYAGRWKSGKNKEILPARKQKELLRDGPSCWEYRGCPEEVRLRCPAYPDMGRECWKVTGTRCDRGRTEKRSAAEKILHCRSHCEFYRTHLDISSAQDRVRTGE
jgi:hypothetical protein